MEVTLNIYPYSSSSKTFSIRQKITPNNLEVRKRFSKNISRVLLKFNYFIGALVAISQFLLDDVPYWADTHSLYQLCLSSSWLFLSIGFCICFSGLSCKSSCWYFDTMPAAVDAFLYGVLLGNIAVIQGLDNEASLVAPLKALVFGIAGLLLVHIDSAVAPKKYPTDNLVLMI
uniref:Uncharacterized protein n=1 Tax=Schistocephalus solidus TaxID=70667 RepID=A0A0X3PCN2_SCHSO